MPRAELGFPTSATKNTLRVRRRRRSRRRGRDGERGVPRHQQRQPASAVALVDKDDWQGALAGSVLAAAPARRADAASATASDLPEVTKRHPRPARAEGLGPLEGRTGDPDRRQAARAQGLQHRGHRAATDPTSGRPRSTASTPPRSGEPSGDVVVASGERAEWAMPAAAWAARSGDRVLLTARDALAPPTTQGAARAREAEHLHPRSRGGDLREGGAADPEGQARRACGASRATPPWRTRSRSRAIEQGGLRLGRDGAGLQLLAREHHASARRGRERHARYQRRVRAAAPHRQGRRAAREARELLARRAARLRGRPLGGRLQPGVDPRGRRRPCRVPLQGRIDEVTQLVPVQAGAP